MSRQTYFKMFSMLFIVVSAGVAKAQAVKQPEDVFYEELEKEIKAEAATKGVKVEGISSQVLTGTGPKDISPECDAQVLNKTLAMPNMDNKEYYEIVRKYYKRCEGELSSKSIVGLLGLLQFERHTYPFGKHPDVKYHTIKLPDGSKLPAIIALKRDNTPRPFVVVKCGVFCSVGETATLRNYLMHLFDQSPFNVMIVSNHTGYDYIKANGIVTLGGWDEGHEAIILAKWLKEESWFKHKISSLHYAGISLGGNAAVFTSYYNDMYLKKTGQKYFNSSTAICPVVSLQPTLQNLYSSSIVGRIFNSTTKNHFNSVRPFVKDVPDMISNDLYPESRKEMPFYIASLASESLQRRGVASTPSSFMKSNNFFNLPEVRETPLLVWASKDDMVVDPKENALVLADWDQYENSRNVGVLSLNYGNHCAVTSSYGDASTAAVLRNFILLNSPEYKEKMQKPVTIDWKWGMLSLNKDFTHVGHSFQFYSGSDSVRVRFRIHNKRIGRCFEKSPYAAAENCIWTKDYWLKTTDLQSFGARVPRNEVDAQALTREFNSKVEFATEKGSIKGTSATRFLLKTTEGFIY